MNVTLLFLVIGALIIFFIVRYKKQNTQKVNEILRANRNVPPLFMLRSAELKLNAIKSALNTSAMLTPEMTDKRAALLAELYKIVNGYKNREITLAVYYSKLGALLITVSELKGIGPLVEVS
jgi:hypothetical protein